MSDLSVEFAGVLLSNPIILASATPGWDGEHLKKAVRAGAAGVVCKSIGPPVSWAAHPRDGRLAYIKVGEEPIGMINLELFTTKAKEDWLERDLGLAKSSGGTIIASIVALPDPAVTADLAREVEDTGFADLLEINVSCPMPASTVGMHIGKDPERTGEQVAAVRKVCSLPLLVKLTPNVGDIGSVARACEEEGADGLSVSNSVRAFAGVDIETARPILCALGGYTGPAIKPIVQRLLIEVQQECSLPVSAVGGVRRWEDVVEYIMLGATCVQLASAVMWEGWSVFGRLIKGLEGFMESHGYETLDQFRGIALQHITTVEELAKRERKVAFVDPDLCSACGRCIQSCFYDALHIDDVPLVDVERCDGCGLCVLVCPTHAVQLKEER